MKIYVGNLPFKISQGELAEMFEAHGAVTDAVIITDRDTGRSKGFGFIEMSETEAGNAAIHALNGKEFDGRALPVNEARPKEDRPRR